MLIFLWRHRDRPPLFTRSWFKNWAKRAFTLSALVRGTIRIGRLRSQGAQIGYGTMIAPAVISGSRWLSVGEYSFIGRVQIQAHAEIRIGSHVCINDGVRIITASHDVASPSWTELAKPIYIEDFAWIATGATILPGVRIGRGAVVGASAVVAKDVPDLAVAIGNPARIRENARPITLNYSPVRLIALYNAWLGRPSKDRN